MGRQRRRRLAEKKQKFEPLSNFDILDLAAKLKIPHFHGVFMRDAMPTKTGPIAQECWILNHGSSKTDGTHWTALAKNFDTVLYFDSFGKLAPPLEVLNYLGGDVIPYYNTKSYQKYGTVICGHLCLRFLYDFWRKREKKYIKTHSTL